MHRLCSPGTLETRHRPWMHGGGGKRSRKVADQPSDHDHLQENNDLYKDRELEGPPSRTRSRLKKKLQVLQDHDEEQPDLMIPLPQPMVTIKSILPMGRRKKLNHEDEDDHHQSTRKEKPSADKAKKSPRTDVHPTRTSQPSVSSSLHQPLPEKRILELILDTLQRRDTYEIFAEPVDPEEVEDYYEIIKEPMDFGTMRAKLHEGMYTNLEQFEHDAFLISGNAMHFNSSATIFFRQARAIHELSKKVFNVLKTDPENLVMEFSGTRRRSSRRLQGEAKNLNCRPTTRSSSNVRANASSRGSSCSFNIGPSSMITSVIRNPGVSGTTASGGDLSSFTFGRARDGIKCSSDEADRRCTYKPKVFMDHDSDSFASRFHIDARRLVPVNQQDISYSEGLMRFVKDLGPTAKMIAEQKLQGLSGDSPTNDHDQPPTAPPFSFWQPIMPSSSSSDHQSIISPPIISHKLPANPNALKSTENTIIDLSDADQDRESKGMRGRNSSVADLVNKRLGGRVKFEDSRRDDDDDDDEGSNDQRKGIDHDHDHDICGMKVRDGDLGCSGGGMKKARSCSECKAAAQPGGAMMRRRRRRRNINGGGLKEMRNNNKNKNNKNVMEGREEEEEEEEVKEGASRFTFDLPFLKSKLSQMKFNYRGQEQEHPARPLALIN